MTNTDKNNFNATIGNTVLCDGFLIPMTDFVNNVGNMENYPSHENALSWIYNYATFLKQPLKLEMFVPCDKNGNIIPIPKSEDVPDMPPDLQAEYWYSWESDFNKAKEKVLFEFKPQFDISIIKHHISQGRNIEYLANFGSMQLTPTALNTIFG